VSNCTTNTKRSHGVSLFDALNSLQSNIQKNNDGSNQFHTYTDQSKPSTPT